MNPRQQGALAWFQWLIQLLPADATIHQATDLVGTASFAENMAIARLYVGRAQ